jgi:hypothetical protein
MWNKVNLPTNCKSHDPNLIGLNFIYLFIIIILKKMNLISTFQF